MRRRPWRARLLLLPVLLLSCESGTSPSVPSVPSTVVATSTVEQWALAGTAAPFPPAVRVVDQRGQPMAGVTVDFAVTAGNGSVAIPSATTNVHGNASAGTWMLGAAGAQEVTATVGGLPPVQFTATAGARGPARLALLSPQYQEALAGTAVRDPPTVRVYDQTGQPRSGVDVRFSIMDGGGSLVGGDAKTDADGVARVKSWTVGSEQFSSVRASVGGVRHSVTFIARVVSSLDPCAMPVFIFAPSVVGSLSPTDCVQEGRYVDRYRFDWPVPLAATYRMRSHDLDTWLEVYDASGRLIALNDDDATGGTTNSAVQLIVPAGTYLLGATSYAPGATGSYQVSFAYLEGNNGCKDVFVVPGVTIGGVLESGDCGRDGYVRDEYPIFLEPGQTLAVRLESTAFDAYLQLYSAEGDLLAADDDGAGGTDALLTYTASEHAMLTVSVTSFSPGESGIYTMTVSGGTGGDLPSGAASSIVPRAKRDAAALRAAREHSTRLAKAPR